MGLPLLEEPPEGDAIEIDEICVRFWDALWLWVAVSRRTRLVLCFVLWNRSDEALRRLWEEEMPPGWREVPLFTDGWQAYARELPSEQHTICAKESGLTSIVEALNCKWRQRQSGLVRKSCGVCWRIYQDLSERFALLAERHNRDSIRRWEREAAKQAAMQSAP